MEQNTQPSENSAEIKLDGEGEPIVPKFKGKSNKKVILLIVIIFLIIGSGAVYFLFLNKGDDSQLPTDNDAAVLEDEKEVEIDRQLDTDQDGLPDYLEKVLGTDENISDTDGDSYSDFDEIKNGYNPLTDEKYTEGEWEVAKDMIRSEYEGLFGEMFDNKIKKDLLICNSIEDFVQKQQCYFEMMGVIEDSSSCNIIESEVYKDICFEKVAVLKQDMSLCEKISEVNYIDSCFIKVASASKDILLCDKIKSQIKRGDCYIEMAVTLKDSSICENVIIENYDKNNYCYPRVAISSGDSLICEKISEVTIKDKCYLDVDNTKNNEVK